MSEQQQRQSIEEGPLNSTLQKLDLTLEQQTATAITGLNLPIFSGLANEDVNEFLSRFKLATFVLSDKHRCLALNKCLAGVANTWAKTNIKKALSEGHWKIAKHALIERFGPADNVLKHREQLNSMNYQATQLTTLLGYVEKFISVYKKAYTKQDDSDAIMSLRLNLPHHIIRSLNLLDDNWSKYSSCDELYKLIRRYEQNIMPFEHLTPQTQSVLDKEGVKELLTQLRSEFCLTQQPRELLGAIATSQDQTNNIRLEKYRYPPRSNRKPYFGKRKYPYSDQQPSLTTSNQDHKQPKLAIESNQNSQMINQSEQSYAIQNNEMQRDRFRHERRNKPPSPCYYCGGDHWNSDCQKRARDLN